MGEDESCEPEWCYLTSMGLTQPVICEELIDVFREIVQQKSTTFGVRTAYIL